MLENNIKAVIKSYKIMITSIKVMDFNMSNRYYVIKYIKASNTDIKDF